MFGKNEFSPIPLPRLSELVLEKHFHPHWYYITLVSVCRERSKNRNKRKQQGSSKRTHIEACRRCNINVISKCFFRKKQGQTSISWPPKCLHNFVSLGSRNKPKIVNVLQIHDTYTRSSLEEKSHGRTQHNLKATWPTNDETLPTHP